MHDCTTGCGRPTHTNLCPDCLNRLRAELRKLAYTNVRRRDGLANPHDHERRPGLCHDLTDTITRQDVLTRTSVGRSTDTPMLFRPDASEVRWVVADTLLTWACDLATTHHLDLPTRSIPALAEWMANHPEQLANHPTAAALHDEIIHAVRLAARKVDSDGDRIYLGVCTYVLNDEECGDELLGNLDRPTVVCRTCGSEYDAHERWQAIQDRVRSSLATASEIAGAVARIYGRQLNVKTIRTWALRGVIETHSTNDRGEPLHLVGQVLDVAERRVRWKPSQRCG